MSLTTRSTYNLLILSFFSLITNQVSAQSFLAPTAEWEERISIWFDEFEPFNQLVFSLGDSILKDGYTQQYVLSSRSGFGDTLGYVREEGKKVFMSLHEKYNALHDKPQWPKEFVLYDFSLSLGDTVQLRFYNMSDSVFMKNLHFHVIKQDSVNTVTGARKRLKLIRSFADSGWTKGQGNYVYGVCLGDTLEWVEGIGSTQTPFYSFESIICAPGGWMGPHVDREVLCHTKNGQLVYQPYGSCAVDVSLEVEQLFEVEIFPNPVKDILKLKGTSTLTRAAIYDLQGALQKEINQPGNEIFTGDLAPGVYLLVLENESRAAVQKKLVVE